MFNKMKCLTFPDTGKIFVHTRSEAKFIYDEIFNKKDYLQHGIELKQGDIVFDVGANIGLFTLFADKACNHGGTIFAFEPIPDNFMILQKNISRHGLSDRVKLFNAGLTHLDGPEEAIFSYYPKMSGNSTMKTDEKEESYRSTGPDEIIKMLKDTNPVIYYFLMAAYPFRRGLIRMNIAKSLKAKKIRCRLLNLSEVMRTHDVPVIDLLKIDVEGAEMDILKGIDDSAWPKIRQIAMEIHDIEKRLKKIMELLNDKGYRFISAQKPRWSELLNSDTYNLYARR